MGSDEPEFWDEKTRVQRVSIVLAQVLLVVGTLELTDIINFLPMYVYLGSAVGLALALWAYQNVAS